MAGHIESAGDVTWNTPEEILTPTRELFGGVIDLDPCGNDTSIVGAVATYMLPEQDGLLLKWVGKTFLNSPFGSYYMDVQKNIISAKEFQRLCKNGPDFTGREVLAFNIKEWRKSIKKIWTHYTIKDWILKAYAEANDSAEIVQILPASVDTTVWQDIIFHYAGAICYLKGRVKFLCAGKKAQSAPMPCAILYWGERVDTFKEIFEKLGHVDILRRQ